MSGWTQQYGWGNSMLNPALGAPVANPAVPVPPPPPVAPVTQGPTIDPNTGMPISPMQSNPMASGSGQANAASGNAGSGVTGSSSMLGGPIQFNNMTAKALDIAGNIPGLTGTIAGIIGTGIRANNMYGHNGTVDFRAGLGDTPLSLGQQVGGLLGLNSYGDYGPSRTITEAAPRTGFATAPAVTSGGEVPGGPGAAVTGGGLVGSYGPFGMFGDDNRTSMTQQEAINHQNAFANYGRSMGADGRSGDSGGDGSSRGVGGNNDGDQGGRR